MYKVLTPIQVGPMKLKNRVMYLAMAKGLSTPDNFITDKQIAYYENYAKGGVGLIVTGACICFPDYPSKIPMQPGLYDDKFIPGLKKMADAIHQHGSKLLYQPWHPGLAAYGVDTSQVKGPTDFTIEEIKEMQQQYTQCAIRACKAGADGVEFHIAHNYLPEQFLTPLFNKRTDEYGAQTMENGLRFSTECIKMIKEACGPNFAVTVKINGNDFSPEGMTLERVSEVGPILEAAGADMISISAGGGLTDITGMSADGNRPEGWKVPLAEAVKKSGVKIPVTSTGSIRHVDFVESILAEGKCDMVGMGRGLLAEPNWVKKLEEGRESEIRHCVSCMACFNPTPTGRTNCTVNPLALRELENITMKKDGNNRIVAVVGSGPAGLEAAVTLAERGFKPVVFESENAIGGMERLASKPDGKQKIYWHIEWYQRQIDRLGIEIRLNTKADAEALRSLNPYAVIIAAGSNSIYPKSIPGISKDIVYDVRPVLEDIPNVKGENVVVVGAGLVGLEMAISFAQRGNKVTIVDMIAPYDPAATPADQMLVVGHAMMVGVDMKMLHKLAEITDDAVIAQPVNGGDIITLPADRVILCMGACPNMSLYDEIKGQYERIYNIGDSKEVAKILDAVQCGFDTALALA